MKVIIIQLLVVGCLFSCDTTRVDTADVQEEIRSRKIHRVSKGELTLEAEQVASRIITLLNEDPVKFDSVQSLEGVSVAYYSNNNLPEENMEQQLFEAYTSTLEEGELPRINVQFLGEESVYLVTNMVSDSISSKMWAVRLDEKAVVLRKF